MNTPLTCAQVQPPLPRVLNGSLDADERVAIDAYLATCAACLPPAL